LPSAQPDLDSEQAGFSSAQDAAEQQAPQAHSSPQGPQSAQTQSSHPQHAHASPQAHESPQSQQQQQPLFDALTADSFGVENPRYPAAAIVSAAIRAMESFNMTMPPLSGDRMSVNTNEKRDARTTVHDADAS
jgi:hypothetical protein